MSIWDEIWGNKYFLRPYVPSGMSKFYKTGFWRTLKPIRVEIEKCTKCDLCWIFCPDGVIKRPKNINEDYTIDYEYCKGCGICAEVCPHKVIKMVTEE
jgi:pyruvate ferredoxin oxidoreductase delta subunit